MDTTTMLGGSRQRTDPPDPREAIEGQRASSGLRAAYLLSAVIAVLMVVASAAGLWLHRLYQDPAWATAAFRGGDLATLLVAAPLLAGALLRSLRGSRRAHLVWLGMLAYSLYNYAFYVFGTAFNDLFLLHVALFSLSVFALGLGLANVDVAGIGRGFRPRTPARPISGYLLAVAAVLGGMWSYHALRFAATGKLPQTAFPASGLHLIFTLDLALLVPSLALAAVLLWRRRAWGYLLGTVLSVYGAAYQVNFILATVFQANAHVAGVSAFDPLALLLATAFLLCAALLLGSLQPTTRTPAINAGTASIASRAPGGSVMATTATGPSTRSLTRLLRPRPAAGRRRNAARLGFGAFYLATATFNLTVTLPDAAAPYKHIAHNLAWPGVDWLLLHLVVPAAVPLTVLLVAFEVGVGVLLLSKGQRVRLGLLAAVAFQVGLAPLLSWYELGNVPLVALALVLLARDYDRSVLDLVRRQKGSVEMIRVLLGLFVVAHGLVTLAIWAAPVTDNAPFSPSRSWLLGDARALALALAVVAAVGFVAAGGGFLAQQDWWAAAAVAAGAAALMALYFNPWLSAGILISALILYAGAQALQQG